MSDKREREQFETVIGALALLAVAAFLIAPWFSEAPVWVAIVCDAFVLLLFTKFLMRGRPS